LKGGEVSESLKKLNAKVKEFLEKYDRVKNGKKDGEIDIKELTDERFELTNDLNEGQGSEIQAIVNSIKALEQAIIKYRKSSYKRIESNSGVENHSEKKITKKDNHQVINVEEQQTQIEQPPYGVASSSKK
jgi:hypothetical protein